MSAQSKTKVVIGIQARSTSTRLPNKISKLLGHKSVLYHVVQNCRSSLGYINGHGDKSKIEVNLCLLIPDGDPIASYMSKIDIIRGSESDVLSRYVKLKEKYDPDYIVRVTADCPLLPPFLITKAIYTGVRGSYDYLSNVDDRVRTFIDGHDVELFSRKSLEWLEKEANLDYDKEHVTSLLRDNPPKDFKLGAIIGYLDLSNAKISLDTEEDFDIIKQQYTSINQKLKKAKKIYGPQNTHRF